MMRGLCVELLQYITEAIDLRLSDEEINARLDDVASRDDISNREYTLIYDNAMLAYHCKLA